ncbi:YicC/YloC family endoribonuclease [Thermohalobacter berrensis]|uniref:YicC family protein n=1 Tax=Thermohalobacter berrensis TaxID=99594 RepID=A0A419TA65_9FIRM|nr:YicC/YloC family endoribonuclease [Thermohalobacter berrensis]RKD34355.1 YicC family protein [Thermohalobacter berrensis]
MIKSMTGFGRGESKDENRHFTIEIKSVNHRYNDINIRMPKHLNHLEEKIRRLVKNKVKRGRIEIYIKLEYIGESDIDVNYNLSLAQSYKRVLEELSRELKIMDSISIELLSKFPDVIKTEKKEENEDEVWECLREGLEEALNKMVDMRIKEGQELAKDIKERAFKVKQMVSKIEKRAPEVVVEYKEKLKNRINELLEENYDLDENRLENEVAFFADKSNIDEEIVRLYSHINQLTKTLDSDIPVGRKLDFLIQEMNRETNTIGSKVGDIEIKNKVVDIKSELEKIREQIQNIE